MHRIDTNGAVNGRFSEAPPATFVSAAWLNDVQENLMGVLAAAGIAPGKGDEGQLAGAVRAILEAAVGPVRAAQAAVAVRAGLQPNPGDAGQLLAAIGRLLPRVGGFQGATGGVVAAGATAALLNETWAGRGGTLLLLLSIGVDNTGAGPARAVPSLHVDGGLANAAPFALAAGADFQHTVFSPGVAAPGDRQLRVELTAQTEAIAIVSCYLTVIELFTA